MNQIEHTAATFIRKIELNADIFMHQIEHKAVTFMHQILHKAASVVNQIEHKAVAFMKKKKNTQRNQQIEVSGWQGPNPWKSFARCLPTTTTMVVFEY